MTRFHVMFALGLLAIAAGWALSFYVNGRRFNRRNGMGVELFNSYANLVGIRAYEGLLVAVSRVLFGGGLIFAVMDGFYLMSH
jgi:hypothetical protein